MLTLAALYGIVRHSKQASLHYRKAKTMKELFTQELLKEIQAAQAKEWQEFWQANDSKNKGE